jgi:hypothetical protein
VHLFKVHPAQLHPCEAASTLLGMRRILLIDDLRSIDLPDDEVLAEEGVTRIQEVPWDSVLLDHDLGSGGDIRDIVRLLEERAFYGNPLAIKRIVVVKKNPVAAEWMTKGLGRYYNVVVGPGPLEIPPSWA